MNGLYTRAITTVIKMILSLLIPVICVEQMGMQLLSDIVWCDISHISVIRGVRNFTVVFKFLTPWVAAKFCIYYQDWKKIVNPCLYQDNTIIFHDVFLFSFWCHFHMILETPCKCIPCQNTSWKIKFPFCYVNPRI